MEDDCWRAFDERVPDDQYALFLAKVCRLSLHRVSSARVLLPLVRLEAPEFNKFMKERRVPDDVSLAITRLYEIKAIYSPQGAYALCLFPKYIGGRRVAVVAFRPTDSIRNWLTDLQTAQAPLPFLSDAKEKPLLVHGGFQRLYMSVAGEIRQALSKRDCREIVFTGLSLGGALAQLAACDFQLENKNRRTVVRVFTFGAPKIGNENWKIFFDACIPPKDCLHYMNIGDPFPHLPTSLMAFAEGGGYVRTGTCVLAPDFKDQPRFLRKKNIIAHGTYLGIDFIHDTWLSFVDLWKS